MNSEPEIRRRLRDLYTICLDSGKFVVISSPLQAIRKNWPADRLYGAADSGSRRTARLFAPGDRALCRQNPAGWRRRAELYAIARALQGLTLEEAGHALRRVFAEGGLLDGSALPKLLEEKKLIVNRSGSFDTSPTQP